jgi:carbon storage regulator
MLVLTRRANQSIMIGNDVTITVLEIRGDQVRIGIDAPRSIAVHREEVFEELERANRAAAASSGGLGDLEALKRLRPPKPGGPPPGKSAGPGPGPALGSTGRRPVPPPPPRPPRAPEQA